MSTPSEEMATMLAGMLRAFMESNGVTEWKVPLRDFDRAFEDEGSSVGMRSEKDPDGTRWLALKEVAMSRKARRRLDAVGARPRSVRALEALMKCALREKGGSYRVVAKSYTQEFSLSFTETHAVATMRSAAAGA